MTTSVIGSAAELLVYGTAVKLKSIGQRIASVQSNLTTIVELTNTNLMYTDSGLTTEGEKIVFL